MQTSSYDNYCTKLPLMKQAEQLAKPPNNLRQTSGPDERQDIVMLPPLVELKPASQIYSYVYSIHKFCLTVISIHNFVRCKCGPYLFLLLFFLGQWRSLRKGYTKFNRQDTTRS